MNTLKRSRTARFLLAGPIALRRQWREQQERAADEVLNRVSSQVRGDLLLRVDEHDGEFALSPSSHLARRLLRYGFFEPEIAELFYRHVMPERDVIDVGANVGFFTVGAAKRLTTGRVLAIEPTPGAFARLNRNVKHNEILDRVILFNGLASDNSGDFDLHSISGMEEYSSMAPLTHPSTIDKKSSLMSLPAARVDDLVSKYKLKPSIMKVDVEGAEHLVFLGSEETLKYHRPIVISELSDPLLRNLGSSSAEVIEFFKRAGYFIIDPKDKNTEPGRREFGDIFCIPNEIRR